MERKEGKEEGKEEGEEENIYSRVAKKNYFSKNFITF